jgi:hypothetical protein
VHRRQAWDLREELIVHFLSRRALERLGLLAIGLLLGGIVAAQPVLASLQQPSTTPIAWMAPPGVVQVSPCVPLMGEHWARPEDMPLGPIYTVYQGRLMAIEYMPPQSDFAAGKSWHELAFTYWGQQLPIQHADFGFQPNGHEGYEVPHYDLHFFVVSPDEVREITCAS